MEYRPNISLTDIAGCKFAKKVLTEAILLPNSMPELFNGKRKSWKRMLIYGVRIFILIFKAARSWKDKPLQSIVQGK
jgi:hypothetical protein